MSFLESLFGTPKPAESNANKQEPAPNGNKQEPTQSTNPNKKTESEPNDPKKSENPLDTLAALMQNADKGSDIVAPSFKLDPKNIADTAGKLDFTRGVTPEMIAKAQSDPNAMLEMMQQVGRNAYAASLEHTTTLTDVHLSNRQTFEDSRLDSGIKKHLTSQALSTIDAGNVNVTHPAVQNELQRIASTLAKTPEYADASPAQIAKGALDYMKTVYGAVNPSTQPTKTTDTGEVDYVAYITGSSPNK